MRVDATTVTVSSTVGCGLQLHHHVLRGAGRHLHRCGRRSEARFQHGDVDCAGDGDDRRRAIRVGPVGCASHDDFCVFDRLFGGTDLNTNGRRLILGADRGRRTADARTPIVNTSERIHISAGASVRTSPSVFSTVE